MVSISDQIISVIDALCMKFGIAIDWTSKNVMPILEDLAGKYIEWEITTSKMWFAVGIIIFVTCLIVGIILCRKESKGALQYGNGYIPGVMFMIAAFLIGWSVMITQTLDIIKCLKFPELQIVEYIESLVSSSG